MGLDKDVSLEGMQNSILNKMNQMAEQLQKKGEEAGEAIGEGFEKGAKKSAKKIKASSAITDAIDSIADDVSKSGKKIADSFDLSEIAEIVRDTFEELKRIGKDNTFGSEFDFNMGSFTAEDLKKRIQLLEKLKILQGDMLDINPNLTSKDFVTGLNPQELDIYIDEAITNLERLRQTGMRTTADLLKAHEEFDDKINYKSWDRAYVSDAKEIVDDEGEYEKYLSSLRSFIDSREDLLKDLDSGDMSKILPSNLIRNYRSQIEGQLEAAREDMEDLMSHRDAYEESFFDFSIEDDDQFEQSMDTKKKTLKEFIELWNKLASESNDLDAFGQRYAHLFESATKGDLDAVSNAYDELLSKERQYKANLEEESRVNRERNEQLQEFIRLSTNIIPADSKTGNVAQPHAQIYTNLLNKITQEGLSAADAIEQLRTEIQALDSAQEKANKKRKSSKQKTVDWTGEQTKKRTRKKKKSEPDQEPEQMSLFDSQEQLKEEPKHDESIGPKKEEIKALEEIAKSAVEATQAKEKLAEATDEASVAAEKAAERTKKEKESLDELSGAIIRNDEAHDKIKSVYDADGNITSKTVTDSRTRAKSIETESNYYTYKDGEEILEATTVVQDFKKRAAELKKEQDKIELAQKTLNKFLSQFESKTAGQASTITGYNDLKNLTIGSLDDIEKATQAMVALDTEYNKVTKNFRQGTKSMNPFVNAITGVSEMENEVTKAGIAFNGLTSKPDKLSKEIKALNPLLEKMKSFITVDKNGNKIITDIYGLSEAYGELNIALRQVNSNIDVQKRQDSLDANIAAVRKKEEDAAWKEYRAEQEAAAQKEREIHLAYEAKAAQEAAAAEKELALARKEADSFYEQEKKRISNEENEAWKQYRAEQEAAEQKEREINFAYAEKAARDAADAENELAKARKEADAFFAEEDLKNQKELNELYSKRKNIISELLSYTKKLGQATDEATKNASQRAIEEAIGRLFDKNFEIYQYGDLVDQSKLDKQDESLTEGLRRFNWESYIKNATPKNSYDDLLKLQEKIYDIKKKLVKIDEQSSDGQKLNRQLSALEDEYNASVKLLDTEKQRLLIQNRYKLEKELNAAKKEQQDKVAHDKEAEQLKELLKLYQQYADAREKIAKIDNDSSGKVQDQTRAQAAKYMVDAAKKLQDSYGIDVSSEEKLFESLYKNNILTQEQMNALLDEDIKRRKKVNELISAASDTESTRIKKEQEKINKQNKNYGKSRYNQESRSYEKIMASVRAIGSEFGLSDGFENKIEKYKKLYQELGDLRKKFENDPNAINDDALTKKFQDVALQTEKARKEVQGIITQTEKLSNIPMDSFKEKLWDVSKFDKAQDAMKSFANEISNGTFKLDKFNKSGTEMYGTLIDSSGAIEKVTIALREANGKMVAFKTGTKDVSSEWGFAKSSILKGATQFAAMYLGFNDIIRYLKQGVDSVRDIDAAMTELKKVTDETEATYAKFLQIASKSAGSIGSTVKDFTTVASDFARLGYSIEEASEMAKTALIYENVGDGFNSVEEASESIISTMKAFGIEAEDTMGIVDRFNEVGNNFAIDSKGIGDALQRSASALVEGGNSIDEAIGLVTGANTVIQDPMVVGTALKTLSLRLRSTKIELEEMGEDAEGAATSTAKLRAQLLGLTGGKVDIMLNETTFKNTTQILREMSAVWGEMDDISKAGALELMGGKRQANILSSLITNFETVEQVIETSANSAGSAFAENQKYIESIQGHIDVLTNSVQTMWNNTLNGDVIKFFIDIANAIVQIVDKVGLLKVSLGALAGLLTIKSFNKDTGLFAIFNKLPVLQKGITSLAGKLGLGTTATAAFGTALSGVAGVSIGFAIAALVKLVDIVIVTKKELNEAAQEVVNTYSDAKNELSSMQKTINEVSSDFERLSGGIDSSGNNISLSTSEYERYNEIVNEIADMFPEMVTGYTKEGNAILACKGNVEELTAAYENAASAARQKAIAGSDDVFDAFKGNYDEKAWNIWDDTGLKQQVDLANELVDLINKGDKEELRQYFANGSQIDKNNMLEAAGIDKDDFYGIFSGMDVEAIKKKMPKLLSFINSTTSEINAETAKVTSILDAYLGDNDTYKNLNAESKNVVNQLVDNLSAEFINSDQFEGMDDLWAWVETNIVGLFNDPTLYDKVGKSIGGLFDLQSQFKNDKISIDEYKTTFLGFVDEINSANIDPQLKEQIEQLFNIDFDDPASIGKDINTMVNHVEKLFGDNLTDKIKSKISTLNYSDLVTIDGISTDDGTLKSWDELLKKIETKKVIDFTIDLDIEKTGLESLETAISEASSATGMSSEAIANLKSRYQDLENYDPARLFEETTNGIHVNTQALDELEQEYQKQNVDGLNDKLESLTKEYNNLTSEIENCSDASERSKLYIQRQSIIDQINDTATLAAQYEGLTSAYNKWQTAQSGSTERDMYEGILSGKEEIDEEIKRGWVDAGTREYLELLSGKDLSTAPFEEILSIYKQLNKEISNSGYNVYDFFTKDEDGNSTTKGIYNFFDAVMKVQKEGEEWVKKNKDGSYSFDFSVNGGDEAIAEALGISEELVQIILRAASDAGFEINLESAYTDLANLKDEATEANDKLKEIGATDYTFNINSTNVDDLNEQIKEVESILGKFKNEDGTINIKANGAEEAQMLLSTLIYQKQTLDDSVVLKVNVEKPDEGIETTIKKMQEFKAAYNELEVKTKIGTDTTEAKKNVDEAIASLNKEDKKILADLDVDLTKTPEEINAAINAITVDDLIVKCNLDKTLIEGYAEEEKTTEGTVVWNNNIEAVTDWMAKSHETDGTVNWDNNTDKVKTYFTATGTIKWTGGDFVNGTAHSKGTAFARGNWGAPKTETALVGELGPELVVRGNRWFTVGDNGAEFTDIKKGDIVFNHKQTEDLLSKGHVTGRGKAYASGTAYAFARESGLGVARFSNAHNNYNVAKKEQIAARTVVVTTNSTEVASQKADYEGAKKEQVNTNKYGSNGSGPSLDASKELQKAAGNANGLTGTSSGSGSGADKDDSEQVIDFIEIKLEEIEATISKTTAKLANYVDDTSKTSQKNALYDKLVEQEQLKEETYSKAADIYTKKANELLKDIPKKYHDMAKNGALAIEDFVGENETEHAEAIQEYREWAAKADDAEAAELEAIAQQAAYRVEQLNDIADDYQNIVDFIGSESDFIQKQMDLVEESGERLSATYYEELIKNSKEQQKKLKQEKQQLEKILNESVTSGDVKVGSDEWYEMVDAIRAVDEEIVQCSIDIEGFQNAINDLKWDNLDKLISRFDALGSELSHLYDRFTDNDKVVDEDGSWTNEGIAAMGVAAQQMELAKVKAQQYKDAINDLNKNWKKWGYSPDEYNEKLAELTENQWESIEAYEDAKDKIVDLNKTRIEAVKDGMEKEIDAYKELIDKQKEALDAEKDLYDFEKSVTEQQKDISTIERKLAALSGDTSMSGEAQRRQLNEELLEAKAQLEELYYDRSIENQKTALDEEYANYEQYMNSEMEALDQYLTNEELVISDAMNTVKANASIVLGEMNTISQMYGIQISDSIVAPWRDGSSAVASFDEQFKISSSSFAEQLQMIIEQEKALEQAALAAADAMMKAMQLSGSGVSGSSSLGYPTLKPGGGSITAGGGASNGSNGSNGSGGSKSNTYIVQKGDNLWDISKKLTGSGSNWKDIYNKNKDTIKDPNKIYVGQPIKYAKGTLGTKKDEWAWIDEIGEELVLHADGSGKLSYLTKGTSVIPADLTEKLLKLAVDPTQTLENSKPIISAPHITNNEINISMDIAEVVHIDTVTNDTLPDLTKAVEKQMDKYMKNLNNQIRKYAR